MSDKPKFPPVIIQHPECGHLTMGDEKDKDVDDRIHSNRRYHSLSPCTVANVAKVIRNLSFVFRLLPFVIPKR